MREIIIPIAPEINYKQTLSAISAAMDKLKQHVIGQQPWPEFKADVDAAFAIAHNGNLLLLKFYVTENELNAVTRDTNDEVSRDNCVELFISFDKENYYNLEFNCLGSAKVGYGNERNNRILLPAEVIQKIKINANVNSQVNNGRALSWQILLLIPKELFMFTQLATFEGLDCQANFYKCGDDLKNRHFLTWNNIETPSPDFHQPQHFGNIHFEPSVIYADKG